MNYHLKLTQPLNVAWVYRSFCYTRRSSYIYNSLRGALIVFRSKGLLSWSQEETLYSYGFKWHNKVVYHLATLKAIGKAIFHKEG